MPNSIAMINSVDIILVAVDLNVFVFMCFTSFRFKRVNFLLSNYITHFYQNQSNATKRKKKERKAKKHYASTVNIYKI